MNALPGLDTQVLGRSFRHFAELDSTNDFLKANGRSLPHGTAVTASVQTGGKGRLGRSWSQEPDKGLALSVLLHSWSTDALSLLPLLTGLAVSEAVDSLCGVSTAVKWSNDVLLEGRKLCGILCESVLSGSSGYVVVGIGINLHQTAEELKRHDLVYAASLFSVTGKSPSAAEMAAAVLNRLELVLHRYRTGGFEAFREQYRRRCVTLGRPVRVLWEGGQQEGTALDIAPDGALLCEIGGKVRAVYAGEASVRGIYGYGG